MAEHNGNGEKSKIIYWLAGLLQTIVLAICAWVGSNVVQAKTDIAVLQTNYTAIAASLVTMNSKMDRMLERRR